MNLKKLLSNIDKRIQDFEDSLYLDDVDSQQTKPLVDGNVVNRCSMYVEKKDKTADIYSQKSQSGSKITDKENSKLGFYSSGSDTFYDKCSDCDESCILCDVCNWK